MRLSTLLVQNVCRYIVERRINNAAMNCVIPANMIFRTCEFAATGISLDGEFDFQPDGILYATRKTHIRRFNWP